jgi:hypothetical protein
MDNKVISVVVAAVAIFMWFQPFNSFGMFYQSGEHWGGLAYALLILPGLFAITVWFHQKQLSVIFSILSVLLAGKYLLQIGSNVGWGLLGIVACSFISVFLAFSVKEKPQKSEI